MGYPGAHRPRPRGRSPWFFDGPEDSVSDRPVRGSWFEPLTDRRLAIVVRTPSELSNAR